MLTPFERSYGVSFRGAGVSGIAQAGMVSDIDYELTEERYLNGCQIILKNHKIDDAMTFQVVDINNILGAGENFLADEYATNWRVTEDSQNQGVFKIEYPARIMAGLFIRIKYTSTGTENVVVSCNHFLHKLP